MHPSRATLLMLLATWSLIPNAALAQFSNSTVPYVGRLEKNGIALNGTFDFKFEVFTAPTGGVAVWTETQTLPVFAGSFSAALGSATSSPALDSLWQNPAYLQVSVRASNSPLEPDYVLLNNRQRILTTPQAARANYATDFYITTRLSLGATDPNADVVFVGRESNGSTAATVKVTSGTKTLLIDGDEIDANAELNVQVNTAQSTRFGGPIVLGMTTSGCSNTNMGTMHFNRVTGGIEYCDGARWRNVASFGGGATTCLSIKQASPSAPNGVYALSVGGEAFLAECDMGNGGWTLIQGHAQGKITTESSAVTKQSAHYLPAGIVRDLADVSTQVRIEQLSGNNVGAATSTTNGVVIGRLRNLLNLNSPSSNWTFTGSVTGSNMSYVGCDDERYPALYHACNNGSGLHVLTSGNYVVEHTFALSSTTPEMNVWVK